MPKEEERLLATLAESYRVGLDAWDALMHPVNRGAFYGEAHRKLIAADTAARAEYQKAGVALREYRRTKKAHRAGA